MRRPHPSQSGKRALLRLCILPAVFLLSQAVFPQTPREWVPIGDRSEKIQTVRVVSSELNRTVLEFRNHGFFSEIVRINNTDHIKLSLPEATPLMEKGFPELPKIRRNIIISDNAKMGFKILEMKDTTLAIRPVAPSKGHLSRSVNPDTVPYSFDRFYQQNAWYPRDHFSLGEPFILKDVRGLAVQFNPFLYNPVAGMLKICTKLVVEITATGENGANPKERKDERRNEIQLSPDLMELYKEQFLNFHLYPEWLKPFGAWGRLLVVVQDSFASDINSFVNWKIAKGIPTITAHYPSETGSGTASLKNYIQNLYDASAGLDYVILVGDNDQIPTMTGSSSQAAPSDPMYVKLEGADDYPDAYISRISAATRADVQNQTAKFINYEKHPDLGAAAAWYSRATGVASDQGDPTDGERCDELRQELLDHGYTLVDRIYDPGATDAAVTTALNNGRSLVNYLGHGGDTNWGTTNFDNADIDGLSNGNDLPFIIDVACMNGNFTRTGGDCFAERWLKTGTAAAPRGAIGIYASSRNADWVPPCVMQAEAVRLLAAGLSRTLGGICFRGVMKGLDEYPGDTGRKLMEQYNLFGDCTMEIRKKTPRTFTVIHPPSAPKKNDNFVVVVQDGGSMVSGARVTLTKNRTIVGSRLTAGLGDPGTAKFAYNLTPGTMTVCVTKPDYEPYIGKCKLLWSPGKLWVSLHGGATMPYDNWYETHYCFNAIANLEYHFRFPWAFVLEAGYNDFKWKGMKEHFPWWNFSATARYYLPRERFRPFINVGPGLYLPKEGDKRLGVKTGVGIDFPLNDRLTLEMGSDYHTIFSGGKKDNLRQDTKTTFQHFHTGFTYNLR